MPGEDKILKIDELSLADQQFIKDILSGKAIPPLYSDIIAKRIFNPDVHADRLNFLLRRIAKDETIDVASSAGSVTRPYRNTYHETDKAMTIDIVFSIMPCMIKKFCHVIKLLPKLLYHCIIDTEKDREGRKRFRYNSDSPFRYYFKQGLAVYIRITESVIH